MMYVIVIVDEVTTSRYSKYFSEVEKKKKEVYFVAFFNFPLLVE